MNGFLVDLAERVLAPPDHLRPRAAAPFEPAPSGIPVDDVLEPSDGRVIESSDPDVDLEPPSDAAVSHRSSRSPGPAESPALGRMSIEEPPPSDLAPRRQAMQAAQTTTQNPARAQRAARGDASSPREAPPPTHPDRRSEPSRLPPARVPSGDAAPAASSPAATVRAASPPGSAPALPTAVARRISLPGRPKRSPATEARVADQPPIVRVSIGRIEVRATQPVPSPQPAPPRHQPSHLPLSEYLRQRDAGER